MGFPVTVKSLESSLKPFDFFFLFAGSKMCLRCDHYRRVLGVRGDANSCDVTDTCLPVSPARYNEICGGVQELRQCKFFVCIAFLVTTLTTNETHT